MARTVTLRLPEDIYNRLKQSARVAERPMEEVVMQSVKAGMPPSVDSLPPEYREEFLAMEHLSDEQLWHVAESAMPAGCQRRYTYLLRKNQAGGLTEREREQLAQLGAEARKLTLRKAHAYALLRWRGQCIPTSAELRQPR